MEARIPRATSTPARTPSSPETKERPIKAVLSRVTHASVEVAGTTIAEIPSGILALVGVQVGDDVTDAHAMASKIARLRILDRDGAQVAASDIGAPILVVSQFTLLGATRKGRRPSWSAAAKGAEAEPLVATVAETIRHDYGLTVAEGRFGAEMRVASVNDGPFTVLVDTRE